MMDYVANMHLMHFSDILNYQHMNLNYIKINMMMNILTNLILKHHVNYLTSYHQIRKI